MNSVYATVVGVHGQATYTVTIVSTPAGTPVSGSTNTFDYPILSNVTLTCMVTSSDGSTPAVTSYSWNATGCSINKAHEDPTCFHTGQTTQSVTNNNLLAEDAGTVTCTAIIGGIDYTSGPLTLRISGSCNLYYIKIYVSCKKGAAPFKRQGKESCKISGGGQEITVMIIMLMA